MLLILQAALQPITTPAPSDLISVSSVIVASGLGSIQSYEAKYKPL